MISLFATLRVVNSPILKATAPAEPGPLESAELAGLRISRRRRLQRSFQWTWQLRCRWNGRCHCHWPERWSPAYQRLRNSQARLWRYLATSRFARWLAGASSAPALRRWRGPWPALRRPSFGARGLLQRRSEERRARDGARGPRPRRQSSANVRTTRD